MTQAPLPSLHRTHARLRAWLTIGYALFIVYASLSPFTGWRNQGVDFGEVLAMPLSLRYNAFDALANLLSYLPLGFLAGLTLRARYGAAASLAVGLGSGMLLSGSMEYLQMYLPSRTSSNMDLLSNVAGMLTGALLAAGLMSRPQLLARLTHWRIAVFRHGKEMDFGLALLALWMFVQTNPSLPLLGNVFISQVVQQPFVQLPPEPFDGWQSLAVMLNLLMLGSLLLTLLHAPRHLATALLAALGAVALAKFAAAALLLKSWALLLWINGEAVLGITLGMLLLLAARSRSALLLGAPSAAAYLLIVSLMLDSSMPSGRASLYHWHYGHLFTYNGLAQTVSLCFPLLLIVHLWRCRKV